MIEIENKADLLTRLFTAMAERGELPSLQSSSDRIIASLKDEEAYLADLTNLVLSDISLSQKVIRQANSAMRHSFGDEIISISRAIRVLGVNTVEQFSAELPDIADFQANSRHLDTGRDALKRAMVASEFARNMTHRHASQASEEAVLSTLMYLLAPTVLALYLEKDWQQVLDYTRLYPDVTIRDACREVLGVSLTDIAAALARHFNVPETLADCMAGTLPDADMRNDSHTQWLIMISTVAAEVATMIEKKTALRDIEQFVKPYLNALGMDAPTLNNALEHAQSAAVRVDRGGRGRANDAEAFEMPANPMERFGEALTHVRSLAPTLNTAGVIPLVVENIGQCLNLRNGFLLLLNTKENVYAAKVTYGEGVRDHLLDLRFNAGFEENIFHQALGSRNPTFFQDVRADSFVYRVPEWYKTAFPTARSIVFVPVHLNDRCIALFCGTWGAIAASRPLLHGESQSVKALADEISRSLERSIRR